MKAAISPPHRYPSGKITEADREPKMTEAEKWGVALFQRGKFGATEENFKGHLWESPLGRMRQWAIDARCDGEGLSSRQYEALARFARLRTNYMTATDAPKDSPKALGGEMVSRGTLPGVGITDDEWDGKSEREFNGARSAILSYGQPGVEWLKTAMALARGDDNAPEQDDLWRSRLPSARCAANILAKYFGM